MKNDTSGDMGKLFDLEGGVAAMLTGSGQAAGVPVELIRISCGIEDKDDLIADIAQALEKC